jgi:hypothetical protein
MLAVVTAGAVGVIAACAIVTGVEDGVVASGKMSGAGGSGCAVAVTGTDDDIATTACTTADPFGAVAAGVAAFGATVSVIVPSGSGCAITVTAVPAGNGVLSFISSISLASLSCVSPFGAGPITMASSGWPAFSPSVARAARSNATLAAGSCDAGAGFGCGVTIGTLIRGVCRIRVNEH